MIAESKYKVLIVDDEKPVRQVIKALGEWDELGIDELYEAFEGESALSIMRQVKPEIVFVDMKMPNMNGVDFLQVACREFGGTKFIVISGYDDFEYTKQAIRSKVLDYLLKPVVEQELNDVLKIAVMELDEEREKYAAGAGIVSSACEGIDPKDCEKSYLYEIKDFIDRNYSSEIKLTTFSYKYYLSKEYLSRQFKEEFGCGIYGYVLKVRMERAKEMISDANIKIHSISERLGYRDNNYFSKAFKTFYGVSPSEYREMILKKK